MSVKPSVPRSASAPERASVGRTRTARRRDVPRRNAPESSRARILDAAEDQLGGRWICYGTERDSAWFSIRDLITTPNEVYARLSEAGVSCLGRSAQDRLKRKIDEHTVYRPALIASQPGWVEHFYVFGDGTVMSPHGERREVIIAFELDPKFQPRGTLKGWQRAIGPIAADQTMPLFCLAYSFVAPLLNFAPPDYLNPMVELAGEPQSGKSTLGVAFASVWAGDPKSRIGGGVKWDATLNSFDDVKLQHADAGLFLDDRSLAESQEVTKKTVFKMSGTEQKRRKGDNKRVNHARVAIFSTTNAPLAQSISGTQDVVAAAESRMLTILIDDENRALERIPDGFRSTRDAIEQLHQAAYDNYGEPGREFVRWLLDQAARDDEGLKRRIQKLLKQYRGFQEALDTPSSRVTKTFALTAVAGYLACNAGILPGSRRAFVEAVRRVHRLVIRGNERPPQPSAIDCVEEYVRQHRRELLRVSDLNTPLSLEGFEAAAGFVRQAGDRMEVLVPSVRFQSHFPDYRPLMQDLRAAGLARTEGGARPKLTIKAPSAICRTGRVYCVVIGPTTAVGRG